MMNNIIVQDRGLSCCPQVWRPIAYQLAIRNNLSPLLDESLYPQHGYVGMNIDLIKTPSLTQVI